MSRAARWLAALLTAVVLAGCGLPLESGVRSPGPVAGDAQEPGGTQALPPGPQPGAGPAALVQGFLSAQANPEDDHAVAREYLHPDERAAWDDDRVLIRTPAVDLEVDPSDETRVVLRTQLVASIALDGSYSLSAQQLEEVYRLRRDDTGQLRLSEVPDGLRLTAGDAFQSFQPYDVFFLRGGESDQEMPRLVPDRIFLPDDADPADGLVRRLLAGPSGALTDAVGTAFPPGTELRRPVETADGVVTVDLTAAADAATTAARRRLSAQLVWTLRGAGQVFTSLRLLVEGSPLRVDGAEPVQDRDQWSEYDPARLEEGGAALFVRDGRVAALGGRAPASEATDGRLPVELAVASPSTRQLALLSEGSVVRTGPVRGPFEIALARGPVGSLSWGPGDQGLWVVETGPAPQVLLVPNARAEPVTVPYSQPPGAGPLASLRISRDGARAAAVFGEGAGRQVFVGRVVGGGPDAGTGARLADFLPVAPGLTDVADVTWESGTSLVVLGALGTATRLPVRVAVDGSELEPVRTLGLDGEPQTVTAAPDRPLVVGALLSGEQVLFVEQGGLFRAPVPGVAPAYPG
jgi:hypothetical protein